MDKWLLRHSSNNPFGIAHMACSCNHNGGWCYQHHKLMTPRAAYLCKHSEKHFRMFERNAQKITQDIDAGVPTIRRAASFLRSMLKWSASYFTTIRPKGRIDICRSCEAHDGGWCRLCGCILWFKTRLPHESCPLGRWSSEDQPGVIYPSGKVTSDGTAVPHVLQVITKPKGCGCKK